jgi:hypothetical protein
MGEAICGFWLRYSGQQVEASALNFHMTVALLTSASIVATLIAGRGRLR